MANNTGYETPDWYAGQSISDVDPNVVKQRLNEIYQDEPAVPSNSQTVNEYLTNGDVKAPSQFRSISLDPTFTGDPVNAPGVVPITKVRNAMDSMRRMFPDAKDDADRVSQYVDYFRARDGRLASFLPDSPSAGNDLEKLLKDADSDDPEAQQRVKDYAVLNATWNKSNDLIGTGTANTAKGIYDYAKAGLTDPTTYVGAGAFTKIFGGKAVAEAGKLVMQQGVDEALKKIAQKQLAAAALKDTVVTQAAQGAAQNLAQQDIDKNLGQRDDLSLKEAGIAGGLSGITAGALDAGGSYAASRFAQRFVNAPKLKEPGKISQAIDNVTGKVGDFIDNQYDKYRAPQAASEFDLMKDDLANIDSNAEPVMDPKNPWVQSLTMDKAEQDVANGVLPTARDKGDKSVTQGIADPNFNLVPDEDQIPASKMAPFVQVATREGQMEKRLKLPDTTVPMDIKGVRYTVSSPEELGAIVQKHNNDIIETRLKDNPDVLATASAPPRPGDFQDARQNVYDGVPTEDQVEKAMVAKPDQISFEPITQAEQRVLANVRQLNALADEVPQGLKEQVGLSYSMEDIDNAFDKIIKGADLSATPNIGQRAKGDLSAAARQNLNIATNLDRAGVELPKIGGEGTLNKGTQQKLFNLKFKEFYQRLNDNDGDFEKTFQQFQDANRGDVLKYASGIKSIMGVAEGLSRSVSDLASRIRVDSANGVPLDESAIIKAYANMDKAGYLFEKATEGSSQLGRALNMLNGAVRRSAEPTKNVPADATRPIAEALAGKTGPLSEEEAAVNLARGIVGNDSADTPQELIDQAINKLGDTTPASAKSVSQLKMDADAENFMNHLADELGRAIQKAPDKTKSPVLKMLDEQKLLDKYRFLVDRKASSREAREYKQDVRDLYRQYLQGIKDQAAISPEMKQLGNTMNRKADALQAALDKARGNTVNDAEAKATKRLGLADIRSLSSEQKQELIRNAGGIEEMLNKINRFDNLYNQNAHRAAEFVKYTESPTLTNQASWLIRQGMISSPTTPIMNAAANGTVLLSQALESVGKDLLGSAMRIAGKKGTDVTTIGASMAGLKALQKSFMESLWIAIKSFKDDTSFGEAALEGHIKTPIGGTAGKVLGAPSRVNMVPDAFFKNLFINYHMSRMAYTQVHHMVDEGIIPKADMDKRVQELVRAGLGQFSNMMTGKGNPNDLGMQMLTKAYKQANRQVFAGDYPKNWLGAIASGLDRALAKSGMFGDFANVVIPFRKTLVNVAQYGFERVPVLQAFMKELPDGGRSFIEWSKAMTGKRGAAEFQEEMGKFMFGLGITAAGYGLWKSGVLTGTSEPDSSYAMADQFVPTALKWNGALHSIANLDPLATPLTVGADLGRLMQYANTDRKYQDVLPYISYILHTLSQTMVNKTFVQGISNLLQSINEPEQYGKQFVNGLAGSLVPNVWARAQNIGDKFIYDTATPLDAIRARLGLREGLYPKVSAAGQLRQNDTDYPLFNPLRTATDKNNPIADEMMRLRLTIKAPSRELANTISMTNEEYFMYSLIRQRALSQNLSELFTSKAYKKMGDGEKAQAISSIGSAATKQAKDELFKAYPYLERAIIAKKKAKLADPRVPSVPAFMGDQ